MFLLIQQMFFFSFKYNVRLNQHFLMFQNKRYILKIDNICSTYAHILIM